MYQSGSISTPGTSIQGQLLRHALSPMGGGALAPSGLHRTLHRTWPILTQTVTQCGVPGILPYGNGLELFVAGRVDARNSPFSAPWPLSPLYLHTDSRAEEWQLTRLPDCVGGRQYFVSGIPSAVMNGEDLLVYFNGAQLLEYRCSPDRWWQVSAVPTPDVIVEANPVAAIAGGSVFVFAIPGGESLLMCSRLLAASDWRFTDLGGEASGRAFDGDPAIVSFAGRLHVFLSAGSRGLTAPSAFELWDFVVDPETLATRLYSVSANVSANLDTLDGQPANAIAGTPSAVASDQGIRVFVRSADDRLLEFSSSDGQSWSCAHVSPNTIGGDPGAVVLSDGTPLVCAVDHRGRLLQFTCDKGAWRGTEISADPNEAQRRPLPVISASGLSVFDLKVAV